MQWSITTTIRTPEKELKQVKRYSKATEYETVEAVVEYYIKDEDDFAQFVKYQPPVPVFDCSVIKKARELLGDDGLAAPWAQGAFNSASFFRKLDDLIVDPFINPEFFKEMILYFSDRMFETIRQFAAAGADIICCGGNVGNATMVGPNFFRECILPYEIEFTKKIKDLGVYYLYHNCGDAALLLDYYSKIKMNIYETMTPPPYGDTILEDALRKIDQKITLSGNLDQITFLKTASEEEIRQRVRGILESAKPRGNFILAATDYFSEETPYSNIHAFAKAGMEFGRY
jgi:uroporphyrinogen-III decarboxylase